MCTVTFIPTGKGIYLTSNRDESAERSIALPPNLFTRNGSRLIYPQDQDAGGSWIALKDNGDSAVLLNGAFTRHKRQSSYRKSRGLILLALMEDNNPYQQFASMDLDNIEPFTLILFSKGKLWECRWNGYKKHIHLLDASRPYIWSSATLYDNTAALERKRWFLEWFSSTSPVNTETIVGFHQHAGKGDLYNGLVINRGNKMRTVSITSLFITPDKPQVFYRDLLSGTDSVKTFGQTSRHIQENIFQKCYWFLKKATIKITNWEYWPAYLVYGPLYLYWCWLSVKARSFFFFSAANPGIQYSGFVQEKKSDIYKLIPQQYYPRTRLCTPGEPVDDIIRELKKEGLAFPLIAKPDTGQQGVQVKLLRSEQELSVYKQISQVDFLLQEYIAYDQEVGIFYYRIPGEERGHISGIVGKEFLTVTGDGRSSIASLIKKDGRSLLQLSALKHTYGNFLETVLEKGIPYVLVPYGNHSRGAKFINLNHKITGQLTGVIDEVCKQIPGFYYGRLDIKFSSWEEMLEGKNFSIIELNGAGSEPTHIYDPANCLFYAWREIYKHWRLLYRISILNVQRKKLFLMNTTDGIKMIKDHYKYSKQIAKV